MQRIDIEGFPPSAVKARMVADSVNQALDKRMSERDVVELAIRGLLAAVGSLEGRVAQVPEVQGEVAMLQAQARLAIDMVNEHKEQPHGS
jgi:hypothetical protein